MRAIASGFNDIDYRLYDMACEEEIEVLKQADINKMIELDVAYTGICFNIVEYNDGTQEVIKMIINQ